MIVRYISPARDELIEAAQYLDQQDVGLGVRFLNKIEEAVAGIARSPLSWPISVGGARRRPIIEFSYSIFYLVRPGEIVIVSLAHMSRKPGYWLSRLE